MGGEFISGIDFDFEILLYVSPNCFLAQLNLTFSEVNSSLPNNGGWFWVPSLIEYSSRKRPSLHKLTRSLHPSWIPCKPPAQLRDVPSATTTAIWSPKDPAYSCTQSSPDYISASATSTYTHSIAPSSYTLSLRTQPTTRTNRLSPSLPINWLLKFTIVIIDCHRLSLSTQSLSPTSPPSL